MLTSCVARTGLLATLLLPLLGHANTFCCDTNGRTYCDDGLPPACYGKAYREIGRTGNVVKEYAAPLTPEQQAKRDAELAKQREEEEKKAEQDRQDRKLVSTYITLSDLDDGHERVLSDLATGKQQIAQKLSDALKTKQQLGNEAEFYTKHKMPAALQAKVEANNREIQTQKKALADREQDIAATKIHFDEERLRYLQLTAGNPERQR